MSAAVLLGDCIEQMATLEAESVQCCVTSPPYWGLRDYGHAGQIGLEATPELFVARMVDVFRAVRRVLKNDGVLWLNLGDSYQNAKGQAGGFDPKQPARRQGLRPNDVTIVGLKPKDLVGIPWMVAFALRADGWYLRSEVVWHKPNPMPEAVKDRPSCAHEKIFLLSKSRTYFYDAEAIKEPATGTAQPRRHGVNPKAAGQSRDRQYAGTKTVPQMDTALEHGVHNARQKVGFNARWKIKQNASFSAAVNGLVDTRNARNVWSIPSQPYPGAHFATFPEALPRRCILAGSGGGGLGPRPLHRERHDRRGGVEGRPPLHWLRDQPRVPRTRAAPNAGHAWLCVRGGPMTDLRVRPWTVKQAVPFVREVHRRLPKIQGALWAISVRQGSEVVGCAIVAHPAGQWNDVTLAVARVAVMPGNPNACSMLYGACSRMIQASGADNAVTYTHLDEHGASLKASNWIDGGLTSGGEHSRESRQRALAIDADPKHRWWEPWSKRAQVLIHGEAAA